MSSDSSIPAAYSKYRRLSNRSRHRSSSVERRNKNLDDICVKLRPKFANETCSKRCSMSVNVDEMPSIENFFDNVKPNDMKRKLFADLNIGDEICVRVNRIEIAAIFVRPICMLKPFRRNLSLISDFQVPICINAGQKLNFRTSDYLKAFVEECDEVNGPKLRIDDDADILQESHLPTYYRNGGQMSRNATYDEYLSSQSNFHNVNLAKLFGVEADSNFSLLPDLQAANFSPENYAVSLRESQNKSLSMEHTEKGVERIRQGEHYISLTHFNRALDVWKENVEALVGRAAAYANTQHYDLAETDLDLALKIKSNHSNARSYMVEILLEAAKKLIELNQRDEAEKKFEKVLQYTDDDRAKKGIELLRRESPAAKGKLSELAMKVDDRGAKKENDSITFEDKEKLRQQKKKNAAQLAEFERYIKRLKERKMKKY